MYTNLSPKEMLVLLTYFLLTNCNTGIQIVACYKAGQTGLTIYTETSTEKTHVKIKTISFFQNAIYQIMDR